jgi:NitT/TauT family transport system ATP-binding protein
LPWSKPRRVAPAASIARATQRVAVARTFAIEPDILLMDEPFGALDSQTRLLLQALFLSVWERNKRTVLFVTHDLHEAIFLCDIVVVFTNRPGRVKSIIPVELKRPRPPPAELAIAPEFRDIYSRIWSDLKDEVREFE